MLRKNNEQEQEIYTTLDSYQSGYLTLKGFVPQLVDQNGKVVFTFTLSSELLKELSNYNSGAVVEASRFAFAIKTLKSQIHAMRKNNETVGRGIYYKNHR